jgi:7-cyano-7-deazaguanine tRNA-ribosyltransferase
VQERIRAHPSLIEALTYVLSIYPDYFLKYDPLIKKSGFFYSGPESLLRPEVKRHEQKLFDIYSPPSEMDVLLLFPDLEDIFTSVIFQKCLEMIKQLPQYERIHLCIYSPLFGIIPEELREIYPLSQHEYPRISDVAIYRHAKSIFQKYIEKHQSHYKKIFIFRPSVYYDAENQEKNLLIHPIDAIIEDANENFEILNTIDQLKVALEQFFDQS